MTCTPLANQDTGRLELGEWQDGLRPQEHVLMYHLVIHLTVPAMHPWTETTVAPVICIPCRPTNQIELFPQSSEEQKQRVVDYTNE